MTTKNLHNRKWLWLLGILGCQAMLTLSSCSSDEETPKPVEKGTAITFNGSEAEPKEASNGARGTRAGITRAGTPLSESAQSFKVWGYKNMSYNDGTGAYDEGGTTLQTVFPGYNVNWYSGSSSASNSNGWEYVAQQTTGDEQTIKYWDWSAKAYRYFAVTNWKAESAGPYDENKTYGANDTYDSYGAYKITMVVDATNMGAAPYFTKLWFSTGNVDDYPTKQFGRPVQLEFLKPFARVRFLFKYAYPREGIVLEDMHFKPTGDYTAEEEAKVKIATAGTFKVTYPLTGTATREWYAISDITSKMNEFTEDADPEDDSKEYTETDNGWYTVLPALTQGSYTLKLKVNNGDKECTVPAEYMSWLPGYSYTYIFKITDEGGVEIDLIQEAVTDWTEMEGAHTVYNW